ncbi:MAG TPA: acetylglutamate kinase [Candidatus Angelobacter sp.]|jgi:acetylglutamate kinase|nr:acetylglutamate kinase [Candidatus Angelobacter sp.]
MKLVIKICSTVLDNERVLRNFAGELGELLKQGHRVIVVHGGTRFLDQALAELQDNGTAAVHGGKTKDAPLMVLGGKVNKKLVGILAAAGIPAFGLCGADGNIVKIRKTRSKANELNVTAEVSSVHPKWLEAICERGGVPVLANVALGSDNQHHCLNADRLAGACAISWDADALVFLSDSDGPRDADGTVLRWLETRKIVELTRGTAIRPNMATKLDVCHQALKHGVRRTRILPLSQIESLSSFYFSRIDFGTEVIQAV